MADETILSKKYLVVASGTVDNGRGVAGKASVEPLRLGTANERRGMYKKT